MDVLDGASLSEEAGPLVGATAGAEVAIVSFQTVVPLDDTPYAEIIPPHPRDLNALSIEWSHSA